MTTPPRSTPGETPVTASLDDVATLEDEDDPLTAAERERGYLENRIDPTGGSEPDDVVSVETIQRREFKSNETSDPDIATEEGVPWVPPNGQVTSGGSGFSPLDEPFDGDHRHPPRPADDEMTARVREALRADHLTTAYAESLTIDTDGDEVTLMGTVASIEDLEAVLAVVAAVDGISEVVDELEIEAV
jgi:BON domain-containing protein